VALGQLAAVDSGGGVGGGADGADGALCSALTGKCLRLLAARKDPLYPSFDRWDPPNRASRRQKPRSHDTDTTVRTDGGASGMRSRLREG